MKAKTIKAILIDPVAKLVTEVMVENELEAFYRILHCGTIEAAYPEWMEGYNHLYVDEEGLFKEGQVFFRILGVSQPLAGRALVVGGNEDGDTVDATTTLSEVLAAVRWISS